MNAPQGNAQRDAADDRRVLAVLSDHRFDRAFNLKYDAAPLKLKHVAAALVRLRDEGLAESAEIRSGVTGWRRTQRGKEWLDSN